MATFRFKAKNRVGATVTGTVDRDSAREAAAAVREMGYFPMDIKPVATASEADPRSVQPLWRRMLDVFWTGVSVRTLALFYRRFALLLGSGMSVSEALRSISGRSRGRFRRIIQEAIATTEAGKPITESIARYPRIFGSLHLSMLRAGEAAGLLESMSDRLASYLEFELDVRRSVAKALFYPAIIGVFIILVPHVPALVLSGFAAFVNSLWSSLRSWLPWAIAALFFLKLIFQINGVRLAWDCVKIQPPLIGTVARKVAMSRFSRATAMLYSAGLSMGSILQGAADACGNLYVAAAVKSVIPDVDRGARLTDTFARLRVFDPVVLDLLATGEKTGEIDSMLNKAAEYLEKETEATLHKATIILFVAAICVAAIVVAIMVVSAYTGYFGQIMRGAGQ